MINKKFTNGHSQLFTEAWVTCKLWLVGKFWVAFLLLIINLMAWWLTFEPRGWTSGVKSQLTLQHLWHYNGFNFINAKIPNSNLHWTFHYSSFSLKVKIYLLHINKKKILISDRYGTGSDQMHAKTSLWYPVSATIALKLLWILNQTSYLYVDKNRW